LRKEQRTTPIIQDEVHGATPYKRLTLEDFLRRPGRHRDALRRGVGPSDYVHGPKADYEAVRALCGDFSVRQECLESALAHESLVGLWWRNDRERAARDVAGAVA
jgi:Transcription factor WhiB